MKKFFAFAVPIMMFTLFIACSKPAANKSNAVVSNPEDVVAVVGGVSISMGELNEAAKSQLQKVDNEIYQIKKRVLNELIENKLIEAAAKKKGMDAAKFLAEEIDAKVVAPTDQEMESVYNASKDKIGKPFDEVKNQISDYLKQGKSARVRNELISGLKKDADISVKLEPPRIDIDIEGAPATGDKDAKVTLIEFSDYQCPFCMRVRPTIWKLLDEYKGKIRYVFRDYPLPFHKDSKKAHEAAHCAGDQKKYFEFNKKIFDNQSKIGLEDLNGYAKELNLKMGKFEKCLASGKYAEEVEASIKAGMDAGVSGTPAYFINGIMLSGAMPYESFKEVIESELKR